MKTYKFKLYNSKKNKKLQHQLWVACKVYNHCIALHKRYWHLFHKSLNKNKLQKYLARVKKMPKYQYWQELPSHAIEGITQPQDKGVLLKDVVKKPVFVTPPSYLLGEYCGRRIL